MGYVSDLATNRVGTGDIGHLGLFSLRNRKTSELPVLVSSRQVLFGLLVEAVSARRVAEVVGLATVLVQRFRHMPGADITSIL